MTPDIVVLFVSDSRGRDLKSNPLKESTLYKCEYIIIGGANVRTLENETVKFLTHYSAFHPSVIFIVKVAAGICEVTKKCYHSGGVDITIRERTYVLTKLQRFKERLLSLNLRILVSFATIPPISFKQAYEHNLQIGKTHTSIVTDEGRASSQILLFNRLDVINKGLILENTKEQLIHGIGSCRPSQLLWHLQIQREARKKSGKTRIRIPCTALIDGVHAGPAVAAKWALSLQRSISQDVSRLNSLCEKL